MVRLDCRLLMKWDEFSLWRILLDEDGVVAGLFAMLFDEEVLTKSEMFEESFFNI